MKIRQEWYQTPIYLRAKQFLFAALFRSGILKVFRYVHRHSVLVLTYHDVLPAGFSTKNPLFGLTVSVDEFEWQMDYVSRHFSPITLQQLARWLSGSASLPPNSVLVTFDDGHRNNMEYALPILKDKQIPAVCFVIAGALGLRKPTWIEEAYCRLMNASVKEWISTTGERLPLETQEERCAACGRLFSILRTLPEDRQQAELARLREQIPGEIRAQYPGRFEFLGADDMKYLQKNNVEIGAHTMTHPILCTLNDNDAQKEIVASKNQLEEASRSPVRAFAYPFGVANLDFTGRDRKLVEQAGFELAFAADGGLVNRASHRYALPRVGVGRMSRAHFAATTAGGIDFVKAALRLNL